MRACWSRSDSNDVSRHGNLFRNGRRRRRRKLLVPMHLLGQLKDIPTEMGGSGEVLPE
jgi:hypothetical protein